MSKKKNRYAKAKKVKKRSRLDWLDLAQRSGRYVTMSDRDYYISDEGPWVRMDRIRSVI